MFDTCELLSTGMQLPGYMQTKLSPRCFIPVGAVNGSIQQIVEVQTTHLAPNFEFEQG